MNPDALKNIMTDTGVRFGLTAPDSELNPGSRSLPFEVSSWNEAVFWLRCGYRVTQYIVRDSMWEPYQDFLPGDL